MAVVNNGGISVAYCDFVFGNFGTNKKININLILNQATFNNVKSNFREKTKIMSSFEDKKNNDENLVTSQDEAWVGILYSCISADNQITDSETATLTRVLHSKEKFIGVEIAPLYAKAFNLRIEMGQLKYLSACCALILEEDKETIFALALEVLLADGKLEKEEKNIIEVLSNRLQIEPEMTSKIIEVIFLKNRGNIKGI